MGGGGQVDCGGHVGVGGLLIDYRCSGFGLRDKSK